MVCSMSIFMLGLALISFSKLFSIRFYSYSYRFLFLCPFSLSYN